MPRESPVAPSPSPTPAAPSSHPDEPSLEQLRRWGREHLWMQDERAADLQADGRYRIMVRGEGWMIYDAEGQALIDGNASGFVKTVGHGRREIADAIAAQLRALAYTPNCFGQATPAGIRLARRLAELAPGSLSRTFFCSGGGEAIEVAIKLARQYHHLRGKPGKFKILSRRPEYHGSTYAAMSLGMRTDRNHRFFEPLMPGVLQVDAPHCQRCPWGHRPAAADDCCGHSLTLLRHTFEHEGADTIAAFVATPLRVGGSLPPAGYWPEVRRLCDAHDILLIADEVTLGFGRLGRWFAMQRFGVEPDLMVIGKGLTSGELPVGGAMASAEVAAVFDDAERRDGRFHHGTTFGAHPVVMAAALANLDIIEGEGLVERSAELGDYLYRRLCDRLLARHPSVESVTGGLGLLASLSVVESRSTGRRYPGGSQGAAIAHLGAGVRARGLSLRVANTINITPPLTIDRAVIDRIVDILDQAFTDMEREFPPQP